MKDALVVYGSFMGSTKEVALRIQTVLESKKRSVDIVSAQAGAVDLSKYKMIIIGSAIHGATPHPAVLSFVEKYKNELKQKKTAVFIVCITITSNKPNKVEAAKRYPEKVALGFIPVSTAVFGGLAQDAGWFGNMMGEWILGIKTGDYRDWKKIEEWAGELEKGL